MLLVDENMDATAEDDELLLVFWRLAGGAVEELLLEEDIFTKTRGEQNLPKVASKSDRMPRNGFPTNEMEEKTTLTFDEWTLDFTVHLHHTTQTRRSTMPKATEHALITFCNSFCHFFRSSTNV